jgi:hypothetical protein
MGFSSWLCPVCKLPITAGISIGTILSHIALVRPGGDIELGTYDGYGRLCGNSYEPIELWPLIRDEDPGDTGWGDGDGIVVHQVCVSVIEEQLREGKPLDQKMRRDPGQGHFHTDKDIDKFLKKLAGMHGDQYRNYQLDFGRRNVFAGLDEIDYVAQSGSICPVCTSSDLEPGVFEFVEDRVEQRIQCRHCYSLWTDVHELKGYKDLQVSKKGKALGRATDDT